MIITNIDAKRYSNWLLSDYLIKDFKEKQIPYCRDAFEKLSEGVLSRSGQYTTKKLITGYKKWGTINNQDLPILFTVQLEFFLRLGELDIFVNVLNQKFSDTLKVPPVVCL
ncbi:MAG: hypothetical protein KME33_39185 [Aetokthonos hydrillicola CCALA 1050]|jgi:hypothetical protein|nr:hypothetical protein [Aetokthonos hydrillicola CCALA 1050]